MDRPVWEVVQEYGFLDMTARQLAAETEVKKVIFYAIMSSVGSPVAQTDCVRCFHDSLNVLRRKRREEKMAKAKKNKQKYVLKDLRIGFEGVAVTRENCTDELARKMLIANPSWTPFFESLPANLEEDLKVKPAKKEEVSNE